MHQPRYRYKEDGEKSPRTKRNREEGQWRPTVGGAKANGPAFRLTLFPEATPSDFGFYLIWSIPLLASASNTFNSSPCSRKHLLRSSYLSAKPPPLPRSFASPRSASPSRTAIMTTNGAAQNGTHTSSQRYLSTRGEDTDVSILLIDSRTCAVELTTNHSSPLRKSC